MVALALAGRSVTESENMYNCYYMSDLRVEFFMENSTLVYGCVRFIVSLSNACSCGWCRQRYPDKSHSDENKVTQKLHVNTHVRTLHKIYMHPNLKDKAYIHFITRKRASTYSIQDTMHFEESVRHQLVRPAPRQTDACCTKIEGIDYCVLFKRLNELGLT